MAYTQIATFDVIEFEQEERTETNLVAGEDGIVTEVTTLIQPYAHVKAQLVVSQEILADQNKSNFKGEVWIHATAGEEGEGFSIRSITSPLRFLAGLSRTEGQTISDTAYFHFDMQPAQSTYKVEPGKTVSVLNRVFYSTSFDMVTDVNSTFRTINAYHSLDGSFRAILDAVSFGIKSNEEIYRCGFSILNNSDIFNINNLLVNGEISDSIFGNVGSSDRKFYVDFLPNDRSIKPIAADNFTDEEDPMFVYKVTTGQSFVYATYENKTYPSWADDKVVSLQAALSLDGETELIEYKNVPTDNSIYTFKLTEAEREIIRNAVTNSSTVPIYYLIKVTREVSNETVECFSSTQRNLTIVGCNPSLNPIVKDIKPETLALTGDENTFIRYESMAEFAINATASKHATIVSQSVTCGSKTISNLPNGVIDDVESGTFNFYVTDSRNMGAASAVFKNLVEYVKPTCYQKLEVELSGETSANIKVTVNGNYYNGSFGAANNTLQLEVRYTDDNGNMGAWKTLTGTPTYNGNTYELETTFGGFNYGKAYTFQCRATDKLNVVESSQYKIRLLPVFDWSETDFNFNVPVNIDADNFNMHNETIIRHSDTTNNTVLSATGGHIYIRPGGTNDTSGETIFYPNGDVKFNGVVDLGNSFTIDGNILADYIIETGETSMGSNGTWYWAKWASGKAECWGCRNFGNMAVTTAWGGLYRSAFLTQSLPEDVFITTPDVININIVNATFGGWICKHENTAPSAVTTGSFIFVRPASATVTAPTYIGFHVIGLWKQ